jgi:hypothetical protein
MRYTEADLKMIEEYKNFKVKHNGQDKYKEYLKLIPFEDRRYQCRQCYCVFAYKDLIDGMCPECYTDASITQRCPLDTRCQCEHSVSMSIEYCPICDQVVCPQCGINHSVVGITRVTGYLADVSGFGNGKKQEVKDRVRTEIHNGNFKQVSK